MNCWQRVVAYVRDKIDPIAPIRPNEKVSEAKIDPIDQIAPIPPHPYRTAGQAVESAPDVEVETKSESDLAQRMGWRQRLEQRKRMEPIVTPTPLTKWDYLVRELARIEPEMSFQLSDKWQMGRPTITIRYEDQIGSVTLLDFKSDRENVDSVEAEIDRLKAAYAQQHGRDHAGKPRRLRTR